mmetsp:Transcript_39084/g.84277  ORF Transcript_39084/g.84277 Transcript_39084/m.84277 type:complete len:200 (+) Transcript_39084:3-602(+)
MHQRTYSYQIDDPPVLRISPSQTPHYHWSECQTTSPLRTYPRPCYYQSEEGRMTLPRAQSNPASSPHHHHRRHRQRHHELQPPKKPDGGPPRAPPHRRSAPPAPRKFSSRTRTAPCRTRSSSRWRSTQRFPPSRWDVPRSYRPGGLHRRGTRMLPRRCCCFCCYHYYRLLLLLPASSIRSNVGIEPWILQCRRRVPRGI